MNLKFALGLVLAAVLVSERMLAEAPRGDRERMIGLVRVPAIVSNAEPPGDHLSHSLSLRVKPSSGAAIARVITRPDELELLWKTHSDLAIAYDSSQGGWFLVRYRTGDNKIALAWLDPADAGEFKHLTDLYEQGLIYMTEAWDRRIYRRPAIGSESEIVKVEGGPGQIWRTPFGSDSAIKGVEEKHDADFVKFVNVEGDVWLLVVILGPGRCAGEHNQEPVIAAGWVPIYGSQGKPNVWYDDEC